MHTHNLSPWIHDHVFGEDNYPPIPAVDVFKDWAIASPPAELMPAGAIS
jgi:hypothetical protein